MSKSKAAAARTNPPDRDGDGAPGGSLPGNKTVDAAKGPAPDAGAEPREPDTLPPGLTPAAEGAEGAGPTIRDTGILASEIAELVRTENTAQEIMETYSDLVETDIETAVQWSVAEAQKADAAGDPNRPDDGPPNSDATPPETPPVEWTRDEGRLQEKLAKIGLGRVWPEIDRERVASWPDEEVAEVERFADALISANRVIDEVDPELWPDGPETIPAALDFRQTEPDPAEPTFTPDEIAAGQTPVVEQEGEQVTAPGDGAPTVSAEDLVTVEGEDPRRPPVAVRLPDLRRLVENRWFYKTKDGYSPSYHPPYVSEAEVKAWVAAGLAEDRPTAGREGGVYATAKARQLVSGRAG